MKTAAHRGAAGIGADGVRGRSGEVVTLGIRIFGHEAHQVARKPVPLCAAEPYHNCPFPLESIDLSIGIAFTPCRIAEKPAKANQFMYARRDRRAVNVRRRVEGATYFRVHGDLFKVHLHLHLLPGAAQLLAPIRRARPVRAVEPSHHRDCSSDEAESEVCCGPCFEGDAGHGD